jgi:AMMECR1 domain-containing protein
MVADALSRMIEKGTEKTLENCCMALWQELPLVYSSLEAHQKGNYFLRSCVGRYKPARRVSINSKKKEIG